VIAKLLRRVDPNRWAATYLVPPAPLDEFIGQGVFTLQSVRKFASGIGIAPGIVVGQLQKREIIPYSNLNQLKQKFQWVND